MIATSVARAMADIGRPVSSVSITAPTGSDRAILSISVADWAGGIAELTHATVQKMTWDRLPDHVEALPAPPDLERQVIAAAWAAGAWDIQRVIIGGGYAGALPPCVSSAHDEMRASGWTSWMYKPMMCGPEIRQKAHDRSDSTLTPILLGRGGNPPDLDFAQPRPGSVQVLQLGSSPVSPAREPAGKKSVPKHLRASPRQRAYIVHLRTGTPEKGKPLPASLTKGEASEMIARLIELKNGGA